MADNTNGDEWDNEHPGRRIHPEAVHCGNSVHFTSVVHDCCVDAQYAREVIAKHESMGSRMVDARQVVNMLRGRHLG